MASPAPAQPQKSSGGLWRQGFRRWWLFVGGLPPIPVVTTTPPLKSDSAEGTLPVITLPATLTPVAPSSATPTPDTGNGASSLAGHAFVLLLILRRLAIVLIVACELSSPLGNARTLPIRCRPPPAPASSCSPASAS